MRVAVARKPKLVGFEPAAEYSQAAQVYASARAEHRHLVDALEDAKAALQITTFAPTKGEQFATARLRERAQQFIGGRQLEQRHIVKAIEDLTDAACAHIPTLNTARNTYEAARDAQVLRLARELVPDHRAAVRRLAQALEAVSDAIACERAVRGHLTDSGIAPTGAPVLLPDVSSELNLGTFQEYSSRLSEWRRKYVTLGVIE